MKCDHCGRQVPEGAFCTVCGAHQGIGVVNALDRPHHYAAHPGEHVAQPSVFTTLLPHVTHGKVHEFRYAFLVGVAIIVLLVATGLVVAALIAAIFLMPVLYLVYLYEAQVYRDEPALVVGVTFAGGLILGVVTTIVAGQIIGLKTGNNAGALIGYTVVLPIVQLILIPIPALLLRGRAGFPETIDGLVFGVTAGLGFSVAESIVRFSSVFGSLGIHASSSSWIYPLVSLAALVPLLHGSTGGAIAAALWRPHRDARAGALAVLGIPVALLACLAFYLVAQVLANAGLAPLIVLIYQALPVALLLVYIRFLVHHALLDEARDMGFTPVVCPSCHRHVMAAGFCPACGVAVRAAPRRAAAAATSGATGEAV
ncbi:MAG: PrsW family intramembrane metalloprotease [Candidatus Dormibacteraeota bacterium]|nr:PrsW family intramembrane metalloprotease [Candidatus Dormibacteraeota bacterium]MBV9526180.1 PrsW family intramembrane metalloprotease [Candidatus Dormibacteraeota bacterium]